MAKTSEWILTKKRADRVVYGQPDVNKKGSLTSKKLSDDEKALGAVFKKFTIELGKKKRGTRTVFV